MGNHVPNLPPRRTRCGGPASTAASWKAEREGHWPGSMLFYTDADDRPAYREKIVAAGIFHCHDVSASQFPQLPVPRYSPEQVGA